MTTTKNYDTRLNEAILDLDITLVRELLNNGANMEDKDFDDGETPLFYAITSKDHRGCINFEVVNELLKRGANVNAINNYGETPLSVVMKTIYYSPDLKKEIIQTLLRYGAVKTYTLI